MAQVRQHEDKMNLRLPRGLRDRIKVAAAQSRRSMNAEAVFRLERDFHNENGPAEAPTSPSHGSNDPR